MDGTNNRQRKHNSIYRAAVKFAQDFSDSLLTEQYATDVKYGSHYSLLFLQTKAPLWKCLVQQRCCRVYFPQEYHLKRDKQT